MSSIVTIRDRNGRPIKYRVRYRTPEGGSRSSTFPRRVDAEQFLATTEVAKSTGAFVDRQASRIKFGTYANEWAARQPHRASTAASVSSLLRVHILPTFADKAIGAIRPSEVQAWVTKISATLAPGSVGLVYGKLVAIFRAAVEDRVIASSPCGRQIRLPRAHGAEVVPMSAAEVRTMMDSVGDRYSALVLLLAGTGLRPAEGLGLSVDRCDFLRRTIRVDRQLVTTSKQPPFLAPTKTPSSVRTIPAPQAVIDALAAHLERFGTGPDGLIFTDSKGAPIRRDTLNHLWRDVANDAKLAGRTPHDLRHYAASVMIDQGASVKAVQRHLGHASATTTLDTYAHLWPDSDDVTRRALETGLAHAVSPACHEGTG